MAPLNPLGQPFGAPSRLFNIPAPVGIEQAGRFPGLQQGANSIAAAIIQKDQQRKQQSDFDLIAQVFNPQPRSRALTDPSAGPPQLSQPFTPQVDLSQLAGLQTPGAQQFANQLIGQQFNRQQTPQPGFTLGQGQQRFDSQGRPIASVAPAPTAVSPSQQISQKKLNRINLLEKKEADETITSPQLDELKRLRGGGAGVEVNIGNKKTDNIFRIRDSFKKDSRVVTNATSEEFFRTIDVAFERSKRTENLGPVDIALAKGFQKLTDIMSAVREGEFKTTFQGQNLMNKLSGKFQAIFKGGLGFTQEDRKEIRDLSEEIVIESRKAFNNAMSENRVLAESVDLNSAQVNAIFGGRKPFAFKETRQPRGRRTPDQEAELQQLLRLRDQSVTPQTGPQGSSKFEPQIRLP